MLLFNISSYFKVIHKNITGVDWKLPKTLSEGLCLILYPEVKSMVGETFYNKFFNGDNKGRTLYKVVQDEIKEVTFPQYIQQVIQRLMSINDRDNKFDSQAVGKEVLDKIKNATNLSGDIRSGLIHSYRLNYNKNVYIFLAEVLYYALEIQNNSNAYYVEFECLVNGKLLLQNEPAWIRIISEEKLLNGNFSPRFQQTINLLTTKDIETFLKILKLVVLDLDGEYYLYAPVTDEEVELYKKFGIGDREFFSMKEAGLINLGERVDNKLTAYDFDFCGFQNDNLVVAIQANQNESCQLTYKSYKFTQVGLDLLELAEVETNDSFFTELAKLIKQNYADDPVKVRLFNVEDMEDAEDIEMIDFNKDIIGL